MKNLYNAEAYAEITARLQQLTPNSERKWGKMTAAQMLAHCIEAFRVPLSDKPLKRMFTGYLFGWLAKPMLYNDKPIKKGLPTAPNFKITDERDFEKERNTLLESIRQFNTLGPEKTGRFPHPFFGKLNSRQWGQGMYKHLDHHLQQFGV